MIVDQVGMVGMDPFMCARARARTRMHAWGDPSPPSPPSPPIVAQHNVCGWWGCGGDAVGMRLHPHQKGVP